MGRVDEEGNWNSVEKEEERINEGADEGGSWMAMRGERCLNRNGRQIRRTGYNY